MKKVIVISTSLRTGSNSDMLADQFIEGAKAAGHEVEKISLAGKDDCTISQKPIADRNP